MVRALLVEDSPTQAERLRMIVEGGGFAADVALTPGDALSRFAAGGFDIVVSDIVMPEMTGYELCRKIKAADPAMPVILLSSLADPMDIVRGLECGADNYITKPYDAAQLLSRIRSVVENKQRRRGRGEGASLELMFMGQSVTVNSSKEQILDLLISTFEDITNTNRALQVSQSELFEAKTKIELYAQELEERVRARTAELAERQTQLAQAQKMEAVGQLTGGIAHDFNNLLMVIASNAERLCDELSGHPRQQNFASMILQASERGRDMVGQLLTFARKQNLQPSATQINRLVESLSRMLRSTLQENIVIDLRLGSDLPSIRIDSGQLENAILNLAVNARDAMPDGGQLVIETNVLAADAKVGAATLHAGDFVMVIISDTGTGMPKDVADRVFEPFFTTKESGKGTGLGLSMVYGFVTQSGGHICLRSEMGAGTSIILYLPVQRGDRLD